MYIMLIGGNPLTCTHNDVVVGQLRLAVSWSLLHRDWKVRNLELSSARVA